MGCPFTESVMFLMERNHLKTLMHSGGNSTICNGTPSMYNILSTKLQQKMLQWHGMKVKINP